VLRISGRGSGGVRGIRLSDGDFVVGSAACAGGTKLLTVTENGFGKTTLLSSVSEKVNRGGQGVICQRITEETGNVAVIAVVTDEDDLIITADSGVSIRVAAEEIRTTGSMNSKGVRIMRPEEGARVITLAKTEKEESDDETDYEETAEITEEDINPEEEETNEQTAE
jgi:DNA gyrase subunit A